MCQFVNEAPKFRNRSETQCLVRYRKPEIKDSKEVDPNKHVTVSRDHKSNAHLGAAGVANVSPSGWNGLPRPIRKGCKCCSQRRQSMRLRHHLRDQQKASKSGVYDSGQLCRMTFGPCDLKPDLWAAPLKVAVPKWHQ